MWFAIALLAVAFVGVALLMPKPKIENARASSLADFQFPRSNEGDPVPILKGTTKFKAPNTIGMMGFRTEAITQKVKTGLFGSKRQTIGYKYFVGLDLCLCLGPNVRLKRIWFGEKVAWEGAEGGGNFSIQVWKDANYTSKKLEFTEAVPNLKAIGLNDGISSLKAVGKWRVYEHANYEGLSMEVEGDMSNLNGTPFQDMISSMKPVYATSGEGVSDGVWSIDLPNFYGGQDNGNGGIKGTFAFYSGGIEQPQDPYLVQHLGPKVPNYNGFSHIVLRDFYVGNSASIDAISFEVQCFSNKLGLPNGHNVMPNKLDENPIETLYDLYATKFGKMGVNPEIIDIENWRECAEVIWNENNGGSFEISSANTGADLSKEILRQINGVLYQDITNSMVRIKLIRADYVISELPVLRPSNITEITNYTKQLWEETYNQVRVRYQDRSNNYAEGSALWQDFANINMQQRVRSNDITMPFVYDGGNANRIAAREGAELNIPLFQCDFDANREIQTLRPGDPFVLHWPEYDIYNVVMRIRKFNGGELASGKVSVMCVQDEFSADNVVFGTPSGSLWVAPDLDPNQIDSYALLAAPYFFKSQTDIGDIESELLWSLARKPDAQSMAYDFHTSPTGSEYALSSQETQYGGAARLASAYAATVAASDGLDPTGLVIGNLDGVLDPQNHTAAEIRALGVNLLLIGSEILAYETATALPGGQWQLTNVHRALFDTTFQSHAANANVFFLTSIDGLGLTTFAPTATPVAKLLDRAPHGIFPFATATIRGPVALDRRGTRPAPPVYVTYEGVRSGTAAASPTAAVAWRERNRTDPTVRFFNDATQAPESGQDNELRWRINFGSWTTVSVTGASTTIDTSTAIAGDVISLEVRSRRNTYFSRVIATCQVTIA